MFESSKLDYRLPLDGKKRKKLLSKRRRREVGGADFSKPVIWPAFFEDKFRPVPDTPLWRSAKNSRRVGDYLQTLGSSWVYDVMTTFLQLQSDNFVYVLNFTAPLRNIGSEFISFDHRVLSNIEYNALTPFVFLITFVDENNREGIATIWLQNEEVEIFFPWPDAYSTSPLMRKVLCETIKVMFEVWIKQTIPEEVGCDNDPKLKFYKFGPSFTSSNVWNLYFLYLRTRMNFNQIQAIFKNESDYEKLNETALDFMQSLGRKISECTEQLTRLPGEKGKFALGVYSKFFSATSTNPVSLVQEDYFKLIGMLVECKKGVILGPSSQGTAGWSATDFESEKWERFAGYPDSAAASFTF
jgi:hypothetical protein